MFLFDTLAQHFHVSKASIVFTLTATLAMRPVGAIMFGSLADTIGRKRPLILCVPSRLSPRNRILGMDAELAIPVLFNIGAIAGALNFGRAFAALRTPRRGSGGPGDCLRFDSRLGIRKLSRDAFCRFVLHAGRCAGCVRRRPGALE